MAILFIIPLLCGIVTATVTQQNIGQEQDSSSSCNGALSIDFQCAGIDAKLNEIISTIAQPEWNLVFKAVGRIAAPGETDPLLYDPYAVWDREAPMNEDIAAARQLDNTFQGHYKSSFALNWEKRNIQEVKVVLLDAIGTELISLTFDGAGTDKFSWFARDRLLSSPYDDIFTESQNFFLVVGDDTYNRRWFINRNYGGCPSDSGWLVVGADMPPVCAWELINDPKPNFFYSKKNTYTIWNSEPVYVGCFGDADSPNRAIPDDTVIRDNQGMTNEWCIEYCLGLPTQYRYVATQNSETCRCGLDGVQYDRHGEFENDCTYECTGNGVLNNNRCGGGWRNTVFEINSDVGEASLFAIFVKSKSRY